LELLAPMRVVVVGRAGVVVVVVVVVVNMVVCMCMCMMAAVWLFVLLNHLRFSLTHSPTHPPTSRPLERQGVIIDFARPITRADEEGFARDCRKSKAAVKRLAATARHA
jgi:hypothetical protein